MKTNPLLTLLAPALTFLAVIAAWHFAVILFEIPLFLLPPPEAVFRAAMQNSDQLFSASLRTAGAASSGFLASQIVGLMFAFLFSQSRMIQASLYPYAIFLQTVPIVAIAPIIIIWFGTGFKSVVIVSFIISLFPVITNGTAGLNSISSELIDLFRMNNASRWQVLFKLRLPSAVPYLVTGAKISSGLSVIGAVVGEFFAGYGTNDFGLGYLIIQTSGQMKSAYLFAATLSSAFLGLIVFGIVTLAGNTILSRWQLNQDDF